MPSVFKLDIPIITPCSHNMFMKNPHAETPTLMLKPQHTKFGSDATAEIVIGIFLGLLNAWWCWVQGTGLRQCVLNKRVQHPRTGCSKTVRTRGGFCFVALHYAILMGIKMKTDKKKRIL